MQTVAYIGTGTMGRPMVERLFEEGVDIAIHDVFKASAEPLIEKGIKWLDSIEEVSKAAKVVFLSLPGPPQVESVVAGPGGLLEHLEEGSVIVDLSTNSVSMVRSLAERCAAKGISFIDSPVTGGSKGSREGTLVLMVGGTNEALDTVRPMLEKMSRKIVHLGDSGAGTVAKLVNNQLYLAGEIIFYEGLTLAAKAGLDIEALVEILNMSGAGGIHSKVADRVIDRVFDDNTFALALAEKDIALFIEAGRALEVPTPATTAAHQLFIESKAAGNSQRNFWSTVELVEQHANTRIQRKDKSE